MDKEYRDIETHISGLITKCSPDFSSIRLLFRVFHVYCFRWNFQFSVIFYCRTALVRFSAVGAVRPLPSRGTLCFPAAAAAVFWCAATDAVAGCGATTAAPSWAMARRPATRPLRLSWSMLWLVTRVCWRRARLASRVLRLSIWWRRAVSSPLSRADRLTSSARSRSQS